MQVFINFYDENIYEMKIFRLIDLSFIIYIYKVNNMCAILICIGKFCTTK